MSKKLDLTGAWIARVSQKMKGKKISYNIRCKIAHVEDNVVGVFFYDLKNINFQFKSKLTEQKFIKLPFQGKLDGQLLQFSYKNPNRKIQQCGSVIIDTISKNSMKGLFIGYGPETGGLISGKVKLRKAK